MCAGRGVITPVAVQPSEAWFILKRGSQRRRAEHKVSKNGCCSEDGGRLPEASPTAFDGTRLLKQMFCLGLEWIGPAFSENVA